MAINKTFKDKYGPWAVVTGASSGIGAEFARQLAAAGLNVVIVARRRDRLESLAHDLTTAHGVTIRPITADLSTAVGVAATLDATAALDVGLLVNNAGVENGGAFVAHDPTVHAATIDINVVALTMLAHGFTRRFVVRNRAAAAPPARGGVRRRSGVIMLSSIGRHMMPYHAVYSASKAYAHALALSMRGELQDERVDVHSLEPGLVESEMGDRILGNADGQKLGAGLIPAEQCVREALASFERGKAWCTPGWINWINSTITGMLPVEIAAPGIAPMFMKNMPPALLQYPCSKEDEEK